MKIIFIIVLVTLTVNASRMRENLNVLVPNNDVNVHAKLKTLLADDDVDPSEFNGVNEIIKFDRLLSPIVEKNILDKNILDKSVSSRMSVVKNAKMLDVDVNELDNEIEQQLSHVTAAIMTTYKYHKPRTTTKTTTTTQGFGEIIELETETEVEKETSVDKNDWYTTQNSNSNHTQRISSIIDQNFTTTTVNYAQNLSTSVTFETTLANLTLTTTPSFNLNFTTTLNATHSTTRPVFTFSSSTFGENFTEAITEASTFSTTTIHNATFSTTISYTTIFPLTPTEQEDCILGTAIDTLKWVDKDGVLQREYIDSDDSMRLLKIEDFSHQFDLELNITIFNMLAGVGVLSLAFNQYDELPYGLINRSKMSLQYLSLAGNNFSDLSVNDELNLSYLRQLDMRNCGLKTISPNLFDKLNGLEFLFLSNNNINVLSDFSFKISSLYFLDLSSNKELTKNGDAPSALKLTPNVFDKLINLEFLDLSHTKIETKSTSALSRLPSSLIGISLCYSELSTTSDNFLSNLTRIKFLDLSGNLQLNLTKGMFGEISNSLERLDAKDSNIKTLEWTHPLTKLKVLNLKDNKLKSVDNNSFSHMLLLEDLNLSKNSIGSWFSRLFTQNQQLQTLNLRDNTLTLLTDEMRQDFLSVRHLALGRNEFECDCSISDFMHELFEATKNANVSQIGERLQISTTTMKPDDLTTTLQTISLGARSNLQPQYDIISRTYQKYYDEIVKSIEALKKNNYRRKSKSLLSLTDVIMSSTYESLEFQTVLLDYDDDNEDYQCRNVTEKEKQSMLDLIELCDDSVTHEPPYLTDNSFLIMALSTSIPSVICISVLLFIVYWKWWYIRYFFVLCKNSAILSFMDDDDGGKESIVRRKSDSSIDIFLYDVFVSYSDQNRSWVLDEFIPNIEKRESINVCLHERDFQVGYGILENIVSCMDRSRVLLLLVSEKFLQSQWCQFEMNLAQHRLLETRKEKLILVLLEDIPARKQSKTLKYLMRTKTYIKWPQNGSNDEKQLFWKRLKKSIISTKWEYDNYSTA